MIAMHVRHSTSALYCNCMSTVPTSTYGVPIYLSIYLSIISAPGGNFSGKAKLICLD